MIHSETTAWRVDRMAACKTVVCLRGCWKHSSESTNCAEGLPSARGERVLLRGTHTCLPCNIPLIPDQLYTYK